MSLGNHGICEEYILSDEMIGHRIKRLQEGRRLAVLNVETNFSH